jgi:hypothetical protein
MDSEKKHLFDHRITKILPGLLLLMIILIPAPRLIAQTDGLYEPLPTLKASEILPAELLKGPNFEVEETVKNDGFWNIYVVRTPEVDFEVHGTYLLAERVHEIHALEELRRVDELVLVGQGAVNSLRNTGENMLQTATNPKETVEGISTGLRRIFQRIQTGVNEMQSGFEKKEGQSDTETVDKFVRMGKNFSGVTASERAWAKKVGVDPYTQNIELRNKLQELALFEASGGMASRFLVPIPRPIGMVATISNLAWDEDPNEVRELNQARLEEMGISEETAVHFLENHNYTLAGEATLIESLHSLGDVTGRDQFLLRASHADSHQLAAFFMISARLLYRYHTESEPLLEILPETIATSALISGNRIVIFYPVDYVVWTQELAEGLSSVNDTFHKRFGDPEIEIEMTGTASERARVEILKLGWQLREGTVSYEWLVSNPTPTE